MKPNAADVAPSSPDCATPRDAALNGDENELTLSAAIKIALTANPDVRGAAQRVEIASALLARARAEFFPQLGMSGTYGLGNNPQTVFAYALSQGDFRFSPDIDINHPNARDDFHAQVRFQETLYNGGRRRADQSSAEARRDANVFSLAAVQNELVFHVAEAYYRLVQARELVDVRREAVEQVKRELAVVQARVKAGTAVKSDDLTVRVRLAEVDEALIAAKNQLELGWAVLENVLGMHVTRRTLPAGVPAAPWAEHVDAVERMVVEALQGRPEVGEMVHRRRAAEHDIRAVQSANYPAVDLETGYDVHTPNLTQGNESFFLGLGVRLTLFDARRTASDVRQARARLGEVEARQARLALDVELDVRRAYLQLVDAQERYRVASEAVALAEENLREMEGRYRAQRALLTQVIDAQVALSNTQVRRANVSANIEIARASLERAVGRFKRFAES